MSLPQKLHDLFLLDQQVRGMRARLDTAIRRRNAQQNKLEQLNRQLQELDALLKQTQAKAGDLENEVSSMDERVQKLRDQMNSVTNNREYKALLVEVNTLKDEKGEFEEKALEQLGEVDRLNQEHQDLEAKVAEQQKMLAGADKDVESARADVGDELDALNTKREAAAAEVPGDALATFERLADAYDGEAMAVIREESRRHNEYACGGCYLALPFERVNALMTGRDEVICCPNCGRILYIDAELKTALAPK